MPGTPLFAFSIGMHMGSWVNKVSLRRLLASTFVSPGLGIEPFQRVHARPA
jgi:hypothetical protein